MRSPLTRRAPAGRPPFGIAGLIAAAALLVCAGDTPVGADVPVGLRVRATTSWTDNLFQSYSERSDWLRQLAFDIDVGRAALGGWYTGRVDLYGDYGDLFTQTHVLGVGLSRTGENRQQLAGSLSAAVRAGRSTYDYRDYLETRATVTGRRYLGPALLLRGGGAVELRDYRHAGDFSYAEPSAWVQISRFLPTRTTLLAGADIGAKTYLHAAGDTAAAWARTTGEDAQALASVWLKVAQSLAPRTGVQLRFAWQTLWEGQPRYQQTGDYDPVGELFDDDYSHSGSEWRLTLKHQASRFEAIAVAWTDGRRYDGRPALDLSGIAIGETRRDRRTGLRLGLTHDLAIGGPRRDVSIHADASALSVTSNDPYYDTAARWLSLSLELGL